MKPTYQILPFSGSTNFLPINISATSANSATTIHTAASVDEDELWLYAYNYGSFDASLTISLGGTANFQQLTQTIPAARGLIPVLNGITFTGGIVIKGFSSNTGVVSVLGRVNRIIFT
jgi:hypothetical protein